MSDRGTPTYAPDLFVPTVGSYLTIDLPGERTRATVRRVVDEDLVLIELTTMPMAKSHQYRFRDILPVRRTIRSDVSAPGSPETWAVVEERRVLPEKMEKAHAPKPGVKPRDDQPKRKRASRKRQAAKSGSGNSSKQRKAPPKRDGRSGRARGR